MVPTQLKPSKAKSFFRTALQKERKKLLEENYYSGPQTIVFYCCSTNRIHLPGVQTNNTKSRYFQINIIDANE